MATKKAAKKAPAKKARQEGRRRRLQPRRLQPRRPSRRPSRRLQPRRPSSEPSRRLQPRKLRRSARSFVRSTKRKGPPFGRPFLFCPFPDVCDELFWRGQTTPEQQNSAPKIRMGVKTPRQ